MESHLDEHQKFNSCYEMLTDDTPHRGNKTLPTKPVGFINLNDSTTNIYSTKDESFINLNDEEINELDQGCYLIYQLWLIMLGFGMIGVAYWQRDNIFVVIGSLYLMIFCFKEYSAIRNKRLDKAKQSLIGFKIFFGFLAVMIILLSSTADKTKIWEVAATIGAILLFFLTTVFGAIKVENTLRKQREERRQARKMKRKLKQSTNMA